MLLLLLNAALACEHALPCEAACEAGDSRSCARYGAIVGSHAETPSEAAATGRFVDTLLACADQREACERVDGWFRMLEAAPIDAWLDLRRCRAGVDASCDLLAEALLGEELPVRGGLDERAAEVEHLWTRLCDDGDLVACARASDPVRQQLARMELQRCRDRPEHAERLCDRLVPFLLQDDGTSGGVASEYLRRRRSLCAGGALDVCRRLTEIRFREPHPTAYSAWSDADLTLYSSCDGNCPEAALWGWERVVRGEGRHALVFLGALCGKGEELACVPMVDFPGCLERHRSDACLGSVRNELSGHMARHHLVDEALMVGCRQGSLEACELRRRFRWDEEPCDSVGACLERCAEGHEAGCRQSLRWDAYAHVRALLVGGCRAGDPHSCRVLFDGAFDERLATELCATGQPVACVAAQDDVALGRLAREACRAGDEAACLRRWMQEVGEGRSHRGWADLELVGRGAEIELQRLGRLCTRGDQATCTELIDGALGARGVVVWPHVRDGFPFRVHPTEAQPRFDVERLRQVLSGALDAAAERCAGDPNGCAEWGSLVRSVGQLAAEKGEPWGEMHRRHEQRLCREHPDLCGPEAP